MKRILLIVIPLIITTPLIYFWILRNNLSSELPNLSIKNTISSEKVTETPHPLNIEYMKSQNYPGSEMMIEKTLIDGNSFNRYVAAYLSEGLKIKGLLAIPKSDIPEEGFPAIVFNHGYIEPEVYRREEKYVAYIAGFASAGFIVFMPDYRGHQDSQGDPLGGYFSPAYTIDSLNAFASLAKYPLVNPDKIGMWGHSMGGHITLRSMVINSKIKAGVIWAGVTASYEDMYKNWRRTATWRPSRRENMSHRPNRQEFIDKYGEPDDDNKFWKSISPFFYTQDLKSPLQLHHGVNDGSVPWEFSKKLFDKLIGENIIAEYFEYPNGDHNLSGSSFNPAMQRSIEFFLKYLD